MARTDAAVEIEIQKSTTFQKTRTPPQRSLHNLIRFKSFSIFERATSTDLFYPAPAQPAFALRACQPWPLAAMHQPGWNECTGYARLTAPATGKDQHQQLARKGYRQQLLLGRQKNSTPLSLWYGTSQFACLYHEF
jgi:hypothetical protein